MDSGHESSAGSVLHEEKDVVLIIEVGIKLDNVGMGEFVLYFQLGYQLIEHIVLDDCRFEYLLESKQHPRCLVPTNVHIPELASPDQLPQLEIADSQRLPGRLQRQYPQTCTNFVCCRQRICLIISRRTSRMEFPLKSGNDVVYVCA